MRRGSRCGTRRSGLLGCCTRVQVGHAADADLRFEAHQVGGRPRVLLSTCLDGSFSWESV